MNSYLHKQHLHCLYYLVVTIYQVIVIAEYINAMVRYLEFAISSYWILRPHFTQLGPILFNFTHKYIGTLDKYGRGVKSLWNVMLNSGMKKS